MSLVRARAILEARKNIRADISAGQWIRSMREKGLTYRRTDMLADYRNVLNLEKKEGTLRYVRKGYYPTEATLVTSTWRYSREYLYTLKVQSRITPDAPITSRLIGIPTDRPVTVGEVEELGWEMIREQSPKRIGEIVSITGWTAIQRVTD